MKSVFSLLALLFTLGSLVGLARAEEALVTQVKGEVVYQSAQGRAQPVVSLQKLRLGEQVSLTAGGILQIVYTGSGRQEKWQGQAQFVIGHEASRSLGEAQPQVRQLPGAAALQLAKAREAMTDLRGRAGMVTVRSAGLREQLLAAEATYEALRRASPDDDITPELYLLGALYTLELYKDLPEVLADILRRQPHLTEVQTLLQHIKAQEAP